jgi:hypothetical protein
MSNMLAVLELLPPHNHITLRFSMIGVLVHIAMVNKLVDLAVHIRAAAFASPRRVVVSKPHTCVSSGILSSRYLIIHHSPSKWTKGNANVRANPTGTPASTPLVEPEELQRPGTESKIVTCSGRRRRCLRWELAPSLYMVISGDFATVSAYKSLGDRA